MNLSDHAYRRHLWHEKYKDDFYRIFRRPLSKFWSNLTGFDVITFDAYIQPADGESCGAKVERDYGEAGLILCQQLLAPLEISEEPE